MTINELDKTLSDALDAYSTHFRGEYPELSSKPATESDIDEIARQTFYLMSSFKDAIIKYEKNR